jgi:lipase
VRLHVHEWGEPGPRPLVGLHGVGTGGRIFRRLAEEGGLRILAPDLRGHGRSGWEPPWDLETHLADVLETFPEPRPATWLGHSFGGRLVIELAASRPELVERAVLLDPAIRIRPDNALALAERERRREDPGYCHSAATAMLGALAGPHAPVGALRVPTLLVVPERDPVVGPRQVERFRAAAGEALRVRAVPGGHDVHEESFEETAEAILEFLADDAPRLAARGETDDDSQGSRRSRGGARWTA